MTQIAFIIAVVMLEMAGRVAACPVGLNWFAAFDALEIECGASLFPEPQCLRNSDFAAIENACHRFGHNSLDCLADWCTRLLRLCGGLRAQLPLSSRYFDKFLDMAKAILNHFGAESAASENTFKKFRGHAEQFFAIMAVQK